MADLDFLASLEKSLRRGKRRLAAAGMDLGTTKSCMAIASHDPDGGGLRCENIACDGDGLPPGVIAMPSVVAIDGERTLIGHEARRRCGMRVAIPEKNLFRETKNEIGLRYTYMRAPEGFRNATDIASHLIGHLGNIAKLRERGCSPPLVITVPASFHAAQRRATLEAAWRHLSSPDRVALLDEPYAAFLDLLHRRPGDVRERTQSGCNWLVFDFGGGTCDVAIFTFHKSDGVVTPRLLATSRYHRIGGGDIDRALVHQHLIPLLLRTHKRESWSVSWRDKRRQLEPQLLPLAERLKIALCEREAAIGGAQTEVAAAGEFEIRLGEESLWLENPTLDSK
ncbi:MAG: Hsp70 family protein, partial [Proteobacteria bacterium]|nr:Hsp70 family protein [Pseudomonadota bacterium]